MNAIFLCPVVYSWTPGFLGAFEDIRDKTSATDLSTVEQIPDVDEVTQLPVRN